MDLQLHIAPSNIRRVRSSTKALTLSNLQKSDASDVIQSDFGDLTLGSTRLLIIFSATDEEMFMLNFKLGG